MLRIAVAGWVQEAMTRSPFLTDNASTEISRGADIRLVTNYRTVLGALAELDGHDDVEAVPLVFARSLSGGSIDADFYGAVKAEIIDSLRENGPFDGVVLMNHGAMEVDGFEEHGDTDFTLAVRDAVGDAAAIGIPFDMHGQLSFAMLENLQAISGLRTAPHRDQYECGVEVARQVVDAARGATRPTRAYVHLPMHIPGEKSMTTQEPAGSLWASLEEYDRRPGVIRSNILLGFGWNDRPWVGTQAVVVTDGDEELARSIAEEIAADVWSRRAEFGLHMENHGVEEGLRMAARASERPVYVTDSGDNVSAGAGGDGMVVLAAVLDEPGLDDVVVAGIYAPETVDLCMAAGKGATITLDLGAEHRSLAPMSRVVEAVVEDFAPALVIANADPSSSTPTRSEGAWVRVRIGHVLVTLHAVRLYVSQPDHLRAMGIDPLSHAVYVVKFGYLLPQLEDIAGRFILLRSPGAGAMDFDTLSWERVNRPVFPMDSDMAIEIAGSARATSR